MGMMEEDLTLHEGIKRSQSLVFPGADIGSDPLTMKLKLARRQKQNHARLRYDINKLKNKRILEEFRAILGGKFSPLLLLDNI